MNSISNRNGHSRTQRISLAAAGIFGAIAVALGAYHAHGLQTYLEETGLEPEVVTRRMENCEAAVRYQMYGALSLLGVGSLAATRAIRLWIPLGFISGTILFSGALCGIVFLNQRWLGMVAPLGGGTLILTWMCLAVAALRSSEATD